MGMTNPKVIIPLIWLGCTAVYFMAAFWLPKPDLAVPDASVSGILEIWFHEIMRSGPALIPGFGALWGVLSGIGFAHASFFMMGKGGVGLSAEYLLVLFPFLSLHMLAQGIMIRRGILIILSLLHRDDADEFVEPHHVSATESEWGGQEESQVSTFETDLMPVIKPILRDIGIFFALLFASAVLTFVVWGDAPSNTTVQAFWMYDGMFDYMLALPTATSWPMDEIDSVIGTVWESLT